MAILKNKDIIKMNKEERMKKLEELRMELIKKNVQANKSGKVKSKEIKKTIARILTAINKERKIKYNSMPRKEGENKMRKQVKDSSISNKKEKIK